MSQWLKQKEQQLVDITIWANDDDDNDGDER